MFSKQKILQFVLSFTFILSVSSFASQAISFQIALPNTAWITASADQMAFSNAYRIAAQKPQLYSIINFSTFNFEQFLRTQEHFIRMQCKTFELLYLPKHLDILAFVQKTTVPETPIL